MTLKLWYKVFRKNRLAIVGAIIVIIFLVLALFGQWIAPYDPIKQDYRALLKPPSSLHFMGTDQMGRDVFSRVVCGARFAFLIGFGVVFLEGVIGVILGIISGFFGGITDNFLMRIVDTMLSIPPMVLAILIAGSFGGGLVPVIFTMVIISWAHFARLMRGQALAEKQRAYIEAARAIGASNIRILCKHILPNTVSIAIVFSTLEIPWAIIFSASLSFIGVGIKPPTPEWGSIIADGRNYLTSAWWITTFPGLILMLVVLGFNFLGDGLRDALDPRLKRK
jgi:ABC-type dipeptide/oligopeptide/nickel transport system permease subunit